MEIASTNIECLSDEIAAYIDGELEPQRELELEMHMADCAFCRSELNEQKRFLRELDASLKGENDLVLPDDFTRLIVTNAESNVSGLRRPGERFNAFFICAGLALFVLFAIGPDASAMAAGLSQVMDQSLAVGGFFGHLVYSLFLGVVIILRSTAAQVDLGTVYALAMSVVIVLSLTAASKRAAKIRRA